MPIPTLSVTQNRSGTVQVRKLLNGLTLDPTQDGSDVPGATNELQNQGFVESGFNEILEFRGKRYLLINNTIRERNQGGDGNWGIVYTFAQPMNTINGPKRSGLHVVFPGGVPTMCCMYGSEGINPEQVYGVSSTDGVNFSEIVIYNTANSNAIEYCSKSAVFENKLIWATSRQSLSAYGRIHEWDLDLGTVVNYNTLTGGMFSTYPIDDGYFPKIDWQVHKGKLYMTAVDFNDDPFEQPFLARLDGATWVFVSRLVANRIIFSRTCLISDGDDLIYFYGSFSDVSAAIRVQNPETGSPTSSDIKATVWANRNTATAGRYFKYLDVSDPTTPQWYIWHQTSTGFFAGVYDLYQWNGVLAPMTFLGTGPSAVLSVPSIGDGGNERIPTGPAARPEFDGVPSQGFDGRRRSFRVYGTGADVTLQQAHSTDLIAPNVISTLVASSIQLDDSIDVTGLVGNASETTIEGLTPTAGDAYVLTELDGDRTLNPGGLTGLIPGDIVQYDGANWTLAKQVVNVEKRLEGYWKFDGDGTDRTGNGRDLTLTGAVPFVSGLVDQAADIPGTLNNYWARTTNDDAFNVTSVRAWTLSAWVNIDTLPGTNGHIVSKKGLAGTGWELYVNSAGDARFQAGASTDLTGAGLLSVGAGWQHLVVVFYGDGVNPLLADGTAELYVDGVSVATDVTATGLPSTSPLNIGRDPSSNLLYLDGQVDEVAIWSRALSSSEVTALYNAGAGRELGYPDLGTHATLNSTTALIAPYTDGVDDGKTVSFAGESVDGTVLSTPTNTTAQITVTPDDGASRWSYVHNTTTDGLVVGTQHTVVLDTL